MKWFRNMKISAKLLVGFALVACLAAAMGIYSSANLGVLSASNTRMYEDITVPMEYMSTISESFQRQRVNLRQAILSDNKQLIDDEIQKIHERRDEINGLIPKFEATIQSEDIRKAFSEFEEANEAFSPQLDQVVQLIQNGQKQEAFTAISETSAAGIAARAEQDAIEKVLTAKTSEAKAQVESNAALAESVILITIIVLALVIAASMLIGILIARMVSKPCKKLTGASREMALGHVDVNVDIDTKDELGVLAQAFTSMIEGTKEKAEAAGKIASGDIDFELKAKSEGDVLTLSMNDVVDTLKALSREFETLIQAAASGDFKKRGNVDAFRGQYRMMLMGVNDILCEADKSFDVMKAAEALAEKRSDYQIAQVDTLLHNLENLARGELVCDMEVTQPDDDTRELYEVFESISANLHGSVDAIKSYIDEIDDALGEIARGNLDLGIEREYKGQFVGLKDSINAIVDSLNAVLKEINDASDQVAVGTRQVADGSMALSQGATEQAASIEQLTASVTQIAAQTRQNADNASQANVLAGGAKEVAVKGSRHMQDMLQSMTDINESSHSISRIIKVIDDIAFQTNILALNAAVEAARAGMHGKGFAVVAEEVRGLAAKSAQAAKETTALIEGSMKIVEDGTRIANDTAQALSGIVTEVDKAATLVGDIAIASEEQAGAIGQINQGIEQVSQVIHNNSSTSEESAAASEELSGQAESLKAMVRRFKLSSSGSERSENIMEFKMPA